MESGSNESVVRVEIAWKTIIKVLLGILLAVVAVRLWPVCKLLIVAILLAVPLYRLVLWLCSKGWPRWSGLLAASLALVFAVVGFGALAGPLTLRQASSFSQDLPKLKDELVSHLPAGPLRNTAARLGSDAQLQKLSEKALSAVKATLGGLLDLVLVIALTIYLMVDGSRALQWVIAFFPVAQRPRVTKGLDKLGGRVFAYVVGQSIVSCLFAAYVGTVLSVLHVPLALLLALLAGLLDVIPVVGISVSLILGALMGLTVSPATAFLVVAFYGGYHVLENYFIIPKIYGKKLRLSMLAVVLSMIAGGMLAGVVGAIAALPLVAAYPALEALWLAPQLEPEVVKTHQEQLRAA